MSEERVVMVQEYYYPDDILYAEDGSEYRIFPFLIKSNGDRVPEPGELIFLRRREDSDDHWTIVDD